MNVFLITMLGTHPPERAILAWKTYNPDVIRILYITNTCQGLNMGPVWLNKLCIGDARMTTHPVSLAVFELVPLTDVIGQLAQQSLLGPIPIIGEVPTTKFYSVEELPSQLLGVKEKVFSSLESAISSIHPQLVNKKGKDLVRELSGIELGLFDLKDFPFQPVPPMEDSRSGMYLKKVVDKKKRR